MEIRPDTLDLVTESKSNALEYYKENCLSVDSRSIGSVRDKVMIFLVTPATPPSVRMLLAEWLFTKLYRIFPTPEALRKELIPEVESSVREIPFITLKSLYMKFHDRDMAIELAEKFFLERFNESEEDFLIQMLNDVMLAREYLTDPRFSRETLKAHFIKWITSIDVFEQKSNLLDVLLHNFGKDEAVKAIHSEMSKGKGVYDDEQNVHRDDIQKTAMAAAAALLKWRQETYPNSNFNLPSYGEFDMYLSGEGQLYQQEPSPDVKPMTFNQFMKARLRAMCPRVEDNVIRCVVDRMIVDDTTFHYESKDEETVTIRIHEIAWATLDFIDLHESKDTMCEILAETLIPMHQLCASGYVTRFINVLQGFDERFEIRIAFDAQLYSILTPKVSDAFNQNPNAVNGISDPEFRDAYINVFIDITNRRLPAIRKEYGSDDVDAAIVAVVNKMSGLDGWRLVNGHLEYSSE